MTKRQSRFFATRARTSRRHHADLVNLVDPEAIVVGEEAVEFGDALLAPLRTAMEEFLFFSGRNF